MKTKKRIKSVVVQVFCALVFTGYFIGWMGGVDFTERCATTGFSLAMIIGGAACFTAIIFIDAGYFEDVKEEE